MNISKIVKHSGVKNPSPARAYFFTFLLQFLIKVRGPFWYIFCYFEQLLTSESSFRTICSRLSWSGPMPNERERTAPHRSHHTKVSPISISVRAAASGGPSGQSEAHISLRASIMIGLVRPLLGCTPVHGLPWASGGVL